MSSIGLDYAVRGDLKNAPIRELDRARLRRLWTGAAVGAVLVGLLVTTAWLQIRFTSIGYELLRTQSEREQELHLREHLLLELDALRSPARLAAQAALLKMGQPDAAVSFVIERVRPASAPDRSMVASR